MDLAGVLNLTDVDVTANQVGQRVVYDAINTLVEAYNREMEAATAVFVAGTSDVYKETYKLPGGGTLEEMGVGAPLATPAAAKVGGSLDLAYDLRDARTQLAWDDVTIAKMRIEDINNELQSVLIKHQNWDMSWLLNHLFAATNDTFADPIRGSLTIRRLANTDGTIYPQLFNMGAAAEDNHYLASGYAASSITNTNNPYNTLYREIAEHYGPTNGMVFFINEAQVALTEALSGFVEIADPDITQASGSEYLKRLMGGMPGVVRGKLKNIGWIVEWARVPADYIVAVDTAAPKPLQIRVDPEEELRGFKLLPGFRPESPLEGSVWRDRKGYGAKGRLSAAVMQLRATGTYATPTEYNKA